MTGLMETGNAGVILEMSTDKFLRSTWWIFLCLKLIMQEMAVETPLYVDIITIISKYI
jgi:hypothetical protein